MKGGGKGSVYVYEVGEGGRHVEDHVPGSEFDKMKYYTYHFMVYPSAQLLVPFCTNADFLFFLQALANSAPNEKCAKGPFSQLTDTRTK